MTRLSDTIARLSQSGGLSAGSSRHAETSRLKELSAFGSNPGTLRASTYVPAALEKSPALVVVLHGCTQTAADYDVGSGWSQLADRYGFYCCFPNNNGKIIRTCASTGFPPKIIAERAARRCRSGR